LIKDNKNKFSFALTFLKFIIMDKAQYRAVFNRKGHLRKDGTALIQVEAYLKLKKKYFSTGLYVTPDQWDNKKAVIKNHPNRISQNKHIQDFINKLEGIEFAQRQSGKTFTLDYLNESLTGKHETDFVKFCRHEVAMDNKLRRASKVQHLTTFKHLDEFRPMTEFDQINFEYLSDFEQYLRGKGLHQNTLFKHLGILRRYVNLAIDKEMMTIDKYPFRKYKIKKTETTRDFLIPEEVVKLENLTIPPGNPLLQLALDMFLFAVYTGLRWSDLTELRPDSLVIENGKEYLKLNMQKTGKALKVPISLLFDGRGLDIFYRYAKNDQYSVFPFQRNDKANKQLQKVAAMAGIKKHVTYHVARHTQATYLLYKGVSVTTCQKLLGHRRLETTMIYSKVMDMTVERELQKVSFS
jgi:site-specific recombinase XerD